MSMGKQSLKEEVKQYLLDRRVLAGLWILLGLISALTKMGVTRHNNYDIFRYVFFNTWNGTSLYDVAQHGEYLDQNHYGPLFSVIIAPFAVMPVWMGLILWNVCLAAFLYWAVDRYCKVAFTSGKANSIMFPFIIWFCAHELLTALFMQQFNVAIAAIILLSFYFVEKEHDEWATLFIVIGTLVKLYGIVGVAFFFFSRHKMKFVISFFLWVAVLFCLPMLISSPEYQVGQYQEWITCLMGKNDANQLSLYQNISLLGIVRKVLYAFTGGYVVDNSHWTGGTNPDYSDALLIAIGCLLMAIGYFRIGQWKNSEFRQSVLAAVLMFVCLFSSGTESSGYIIALVGCSIWYCCAPWKRSKLDVALMVLAFVVTSLSPSDLFPRYLRTEFILPYALKALPVVLIWAKLVIELTMRDYSKHLKTETK